MILILLSEKPTLKFEFHRIYIVCSVHGAGYFIMLCYCICANTMVLVLHELLYLFVAYACTSLKYICKKCG